MVGDTDEAVADATKSIAALPLHFVEAELKGHRALIGKKGPQLVAGDPNAPKSNQVGTSLRDPSVTSKSLGGGN
jgi:hypothetical protein